MNMRDKEIERDKVLGKKMKGEGEDAGFLGLGSRYVLYFFL